MMKKRILAILLCALMMVSMVACGKKKEEASKEPEACKIMKIGKYVGLEIDAITLSEATEDDVTNSIRTTMDSMKLSKSKDVKKGKVEDGDIATIDFVGKKDGKEFEGGSSKDYALTIGSNSFIPGFEEGIIGHKVGDKFDLDLTFPEDYGNADLAGQAVVFTVTVKKLTKVTYPELTDEIATKLNGGTAITVDAYKAQVKKELDENNATSMESMKSNAVWEALMKECKVDAFPEKDLQAEEEELNASVSYQAYMYGYQSVDEFILAATGQRIDVYIKNALKQKYAIEIIAYEQGMKLTEEEYQSKLKEYAEMSGYDSSNAESLAEFEKSSTREYIEERALYEKVTDYLLENCIMKPAATK